MQIAIEKEGKEAGPKDLAKVIDLAKENDAKAIFVQKQFSEKSAKVVADQIGAKVVFLDPLAENYDDNMKHVAKTLKEYLDGNSY